MQNIAPQPMKNPGIAMLLSFFITGAGQIYNGQLMKGIVLIGIQIINFWLMWLLIGFVTYAIVWIYGIYDANKTAQRINAALAGQVGGGEFRERLAGEGAS
jgi:TM2 domain-containing membrane protein YozV